MSDLSPLLRISRLSVNGQNQPINFARSEIRYRLAPEGSRDACVTKSYKEQACVDDEAVRCDALPILVVHRPVLIHVPTVLVDPIIRYKACQSDKRLRLNPLRLSAGSQSDA